MLHGSRKQTHKVTPMSGGGGGGGSAASGRPLKKQQTWCVDASKTTGTRAKTASEHVGVEYHINLFG